MDAGRHDHGRRGRPSRGASETMPSSRARRHDAPSMPEDGRTVAVEMLLEGDTVVCGAQNIG